MLREQSAHSTTFSTSQTYLMSRKISLQMGMLTPKHARLPLLCRIVSYLFRPIIPLFIMFAGARRPLLPFETCILTLGPSKRELLTLKSLSEAYDRQANTPTLDRIPVKHCWSSDTGGPNPEHSCHPGQRRSSHSNSCQHHGPTNTILHAASSLAP